MLLKQILFVATVFLVGGCDQFWSQVQAVALLSRMPAIADSQAIDQDMQAVLPFDTSILAGAVGTGVAIAEMSTDPNTPAAQPLGGGLATLEWDGGNNATLCELAIANQPPTGVYALTTATTVNDLFNSACVNSNLAYVEGARYVMRVQSDAEGYEIVFSAPQGINPDQVVLTPALETLGDHHGATLRRHALDTTLQVDWSGAPGAHEHPTFVTLVRALFVGDPQDPASAYAPASWTLDNPFKALYDSIPKTSDALMNAATAEPTTSVLLDGNLFDAPGVYLLALSATTVSSEVSTNLRLGSGGLATTATLFAFWVD